MSNLFVLKKRVALSKLIVIPVVLFFAIKGATVLMGSNYSNLAIAFIPVMFSVFGMGIYSGVLLANKKFKELKK
jgi:hypothetical protein